MRLKCLDEHNKMIPYFEKKAQEWDEKKAGVFEKIAKALKKWFDYRELYKTVSKYKLWDTVLFIHIKIINEIQIYV